VYSSICAVRVTRELWFLYVSLYYVFVAANTEYDIGTYIDFTDMQEVKIVENNARIIPMNGSATQVAQNVSITLKFVLSDKKLKLYASSTSANPYNTLADTLVSIVYAK
jgi:hypothetical protein